DDDVRQLLRHRRAISRLKLLRSGVRVPEEHVQELGGLDRDRHREVLWRVEGFPVSRVDELPHALAQLTDGRRRVDHAARTGPRYKGLRGHEAGSEVKGLLLHFALRGREDSRRTDLDASVEVPISEAD